MSDLKTKKKMLAAESEVYRQLLKLELQTFKVYGMRTKRRLSSFATYAPMFMSGLPLMKVMQGLLRRKGRSSSSSSSFKRMGSLLLLGWNAYRRLSPLLAMRKFSGKKKYSGETAAEEYLSKRL
jgi:hypothetical protein